MSGQWRTWSFGLFLPFFLAATAAKADSAASYGVSGPMGALVWGQDDQTGTDALVFALGAATPVKPAIAAGAAGQVNASPPPGPRVVFSVTQWGLVDGAWVQRQWYGDWPLAPSALAIADDLTQGTLDTTVLGSLQESSASGTVLQRNVPGRLQIKWQGTGDLANTTVADSYQTSAYTTALQAVGLGRIATASGILTVAALGTVIQFQSSGSLASVASGLLTVTMP